MHNSFAHFGHSTDCIFDRCKSIWELRCSSIAETYTHTSFKFKIDVCLTRTTQSALSACDFRSWCQTLEDKNGDHLHALLHCDCGKQTTNFILLHYIYTHLWLVPGNFPALTAKMFWPPQWHVILIKCDFFLIKMTNSSRSDCEIICFAGAHLHTTTENKSMHDFDNILFQFHLYEVIQWNAVAVAVASEWNIVSVWVHCHLHICCSPILIWLR